MRPKRRITDEEVRNLNDFILVKLDNRGGFICCALQKVGCVRFLSGFWLVWK